jgi:hypothetical protein
MHESLLLCWWKSVNIQLHRSNDIIKQLHLVEELLETRGSNSFYCVEISHSFMYWSFASHAKCFRWWVKGMKWIFNQVLTDNTTDKAIKKLTCKFGFPRFVVKLGHDMWNGLNMCLRVSEKVSSSCNEELSDV